MKTDVRELLSRAAATPTSELDVGALVGAARRRRRRTRVGVALGCVVAVAAVAGGVALRSDDSSVRVAIAPRQQASSVPAGWTEIDLPDTGIQLAIPPGWTQLAQFPAAASSGPPGPRTTEAVVVGSADLVRTGEIAACTEPAGQTPDVPGTWVSLDEVHGSQLVTGTAIPAIIDRPADFRTAGITQGSCGAAAVPGGPSTSASYAIVAFRDAGRLFLARIVSTADPSEHGIETGAAVLNTLHVDPTPAETPVTPGVDAPPASTLPPTTVVPLAVSTPDEAAVRDVFLEWIDAQPKDALDDIVEDFPSIRDAHLQGMAQHSEADLAKYSGRVDAIEMIDDTHANVTYSILFNGFPQFALRPGVAIKIDGVWKVSRDTVCDLLTIGGITCPPRGGA